jgi:hypothetical protein
MNVNIYFNIFIVDDPALLNESADIRRSRSTSFFSLSTASSTPRACKCQALRAGL